MRTWIPVRTDIDRAGEVAQLAARLSISRAEAVGLCVIFWAWVDGETADGTLPGITMNMIDDLVGRPGFAEAMMRVGRPPHWLAQDDETVLYIPKHTQWFDRNQKRRLAEAERKRNQRHNGNGNQP